MWFNRKKACCLIPGCKSRGGVAARVGWLLLPVTLPGTKWTLLYSKCPCDWCIGRDSNVLLRRKKREKMFPRRKCGPCPFSWLGLAGVHALSWTVRMPEAVSYKRDRIAMRWPTLVKPNSLGLGLSRPDQTWAPSEWWKEDCMLRRQPQHLRWRCNEVLVIRVILLRFSLSHFLQWIMWKCLLSWRWINCTFLVFFFSENVSKLKKLEYLNLALNNIEKIENLEGKNFVISSI